MERDFITKSISIIGSIVTIAGIISQYLLRDEFRAILEIGDENNLYDAFTSAGLILGLILIVGIYSRRYEFLLLKIYLNPFAGHRYKQKRKQQEKSTQIIDDKEGDTNIEIRAEKDIEEPYFIGISGLTVSSYVLSIIFFLFIFVFDTTLIQSIFYLFFLLTTIFSTSIFSLALYEEEAYRTREKNIRNLIMAKIKEHFTPHIKIIGRSELTSPSHVAIIEVNNKKYRVESDKNDPEKYFHIMDIDSESSQNDS